MIKFKFQLYRSLNIGPHCKVKFKANDSSGMKHGNASFARNLNSSPNLQQVVINLNDWMHFTARKRNLQRLCFYRCLSVHGGWHAWQEGHMWQGACMAGGECMVGACMVGTHPTGMHSCSFNTLQLLMYKQMIDKLVESSTT